MSKSRLNEDQEKLIEDVLDKVNIPSTPLNRLLANRKLVHELNWLIENNPDQRFSQILRNYGFVGETRPISTDSGLYGMVEWKNEFYLESDKLLERVERRVKDINEERANSTQKGNTRSGSNS